ncbi:MAG: hypothetical protein M1826_003501 [Phylliscum demangeonii]|nr:MAG: hypothetical protein M1826_003501 [Phylliscum demangeonii]
MSSSSNNRLPSAVSGGTGATSTPANKSSAGLFSGLMSQKRNSTDATAEQRRASFTDQRPPPGFLGQMWQNFTKGSSAK